MEDSNSEEFSVPASSTEENSLSSSQKSSIPEFVEVQLPATVTTPSRRLSISQNIHPATHPLILTLPNSITIQDSTSASLLSDVLTSLRKSGLT